MDDLDSGVNLLKKVFWYLGSIGRYDEGLTGHGISELFGDTAKDIYLDEKWVLLKRSKTEFFFALDRDHQRQIVVNAVTKYPEAF
jgi:hypothetical protein